MQKTEAKKPKKLSWFFHLVKQALTAYPTDAHLQILHFLDQKGVSKEDKENFKNAWSKIILANQSFGRGGRKVEPEMFAKELVEELNRETPLRSALDSVLQTNIEALENLEEYQFENSFSPKDVEFFDSVVTTFRVTAENIRDVNKRLFALPESFLDISLDEDEFDLRSMMACQDAVDRFRIVCRKGEMRRYIYNPITPDILFKHGYKTGKLITKSDNKAKQAQLPPYISTDEFLGVDVKFDMSSGLRDAWTTWSFLPHFLSSQHFNMFPKPLDIVDYSNPPSQMFCFENPVVRPFLDYLHPIFTEAILDHPTVIAFWCHQLAITARAMHTCEGKYYASLKLEDLLISEEGFLLQHRVGFEELEEDEASTGNFDFFTPFIYRVLGAALGTSRIEIYKIPEVSAFRVLGYALQHTDTAFQHLRNSDAIYYRDLQQEDEKILNEKLANAENMENLLHGYQGNEDDDINDEYIDDVLASANTASSATAATDDGTTEPDYLYEQYPTYTLLAGSHLHFHMYCGEVFATKVYDYMDVYGPLAETTIDHSIAYNVLHIVQKCEDLDSDDASKDAPTIIADTAHNDGDIHHVSIIVQSSKPCKCYLEVSAEILSPEDPTKKTRFFACLRIVVIPDRPAKSIFVQEVMEYLELYYFLRIPTIIFSTTLFLKARDSMKDIEHSNEILIESTRDWITVKKILKDHNLLSPETIRTHGGKL